MRRNEESALRCVMCKDMVEEQIAQKAGNNWITWKTCQAPILLDASYYHQWLMLCTATLSGDGEKDAAGSGLK